MPRLTLVAALLTILLVASLPANGGQVVHATAIPGTTEREDAGAMEFEAASFRAAEAPGEIAFLSEAFVRTERSSEAFAGTAMIALGSPPATALGASPSSPAYSTQPSPSAAARATSLRPNEGVAKSNGLTSLDRPSLPSTLLPNVVPAGTGNAAHIASHSAPALASVTAPATFAAASEAASAAAAGSAAPLSAALTANVSSGALSSYSATTAALSARDMVAIEGYGTYINELLDGRDAFLTRWNTAERGRLRVWIDRSPLEGSDSSPMESYDAVVRDAFARWTAAGLPLQVEYVTSAREADIRVRFTEQFSRPISGRTRWSHDAAGWILDGEIALSLRHPRGSLLNESALRAITLHEIGHVLGLDHVDDDRSIMAPMVRARDLSDADRATASLLYRLPAGTLK
ncbi:MAG TPA: matrixin family metalloprotease [Gemmatimonadales bacterium]|nr:matrixin family metalloprotease [Gemmatimonadales bacterium]